MARQVLRRQKTLAPAFYLVYIALLPSQQRASHGQRILESLLEIVFCPVHQP